MGIAIEGVYNLTPPTLGDGQQAEIQLDSAGRLIVAPTSAQMPSALGAQTGAASFSVVAASDGFAVTGNVAANSTDSGKPVKGGGVYRSAWTPLTDGQRGEFHLDGQSRLHVVLGAPDSSGMVALDADNADAVALIAGFTKMQTSALLYGYNGATKDRMRGDVNGLVVQSGLSSTFWNYAAATGGIANTATAVTIKAAAGASIRNYLKSISIAHDTLGAATEFAIRDGAAGTVLWRGKLQTAAVDSAGGAGTIVFDPPLKGTANTLMEVVTLTAVTGGVFVNAQGFTGT